MQPYDRQISLTVTDLDCDRGDEPVFRGAAFSLVPGQVLQVFGANAAGKSSLLAVLAGHIRANGGKIRWAIDGQWSARAPREETLFLGHERGAKPALTVVEHLKFWTALYRRRASSVKFSDILSKVGLAESSAAAAYRLSAGQRRKLDLARFMVANRPVWFLDEPGAYMDHKGDTLIADLVCEHQQRGGIAVLATHDYLPLATLNMRIG